MSKVNEIARKLNLPDTYSLNPVVHVLQIRKFIPLRSVDSSTLLVIVHVEGEQHFIVGNIIGHRRRGKRIEVLVN